MSRRSCHGHRRDSGSQGYSLPCHEFVPLLLASAVEARSVGFGEGQYKIGCRDRKVKSEEKSHDEVLGRGCEGLVVVHLCNYKWRSRSKVFFGSCDTAPSAD